MSVVIEPKYEVLKSLHGSNKRFTDFLSLGIKKATLAKILIELEEKECIQRNIVSTRPYKTEYCITEHGKDVFKNTTVRVNELVKTIH
jgi:DNA-binding HxlR family transcriptional regulator